MPKEHNKADDYREKAWNEGSTHAADSHYGFTVDNLKGLKKFFGFMDSSNKRMIWYGR